MHSSSLTLNGRVCIDVGHSSVLQHLGVVLSGLEKSGLVLWRHMCVVAVEEPRYLCPLSRTQESEFFCIPAGKQYGPPGPPAFNTHKHNVGFHEDILAYHSSLFFLRGQRPVKTIGHHFLHPIFIKLHPCWAACQHFSRSRGPLQHQTWGRCLQTPRHRGVLQEWRTCLCKNTMFVCYLTCKSFTRPPRAPELLRQPLGFQVFYCFFFQVGFSFFKRTFPKQLQMVMTIASYMYKILHGSS